MSTDSTTEPDSPGHPSAHSTPAPPLQPPPGGWPDSLAAPSAEDVQAIITRFWEILARLPELYARREIVLLHAAVVELRRQVVAMMLAANGICYPVDTRHLNLYLGESQRVALEKTLDLPPGESPEATRRESPLAQALALIVISRWYRPQLHQRYGVRNEGNLERAILSALHTTVPFWPAVIETDLVDAPTPTTAAPTTDSHAAGSHMPDSTPGNLKNEAS